MKIVFLVEELSMKECLRGLLPRIIPEHICFQIIPHDGKTDLEKSIPRKLRGWNEPDVHFVVIRDKDAADCRQVKKHLVHLCKKGNRPDTLVRIACHSLESWFLGDFPAMGKVFHSKIDRYKNTAKFRCPDRLTNPVEEITRLIPSYSKVRGARMIGPCLSIEENRSASYLTFIRGVSSLVEKISPDERNS